MSYPNSNILGGSEEPIDQDTHERGVQAILNGDFSKNRISHRLRNDNSADSGTCWWQG